MAGYLIDSIEDLSMVEDRGAVRSLVRKAKVYLSEGDLELVGPIVDVRDQILGPDRRDPTVLKVALNVLTDAGYGPMSRLVDPEDPTHPYNYLVLIRRSPKIMDDPRWVEVLLNYEHVIDGPNQLLNPVPLQNIYARGRCSIVEKPTNFYYPGGDTQMEREQIVTAHTFPKNTTSKAALASDPTKPRTVIAGGEISIPYPQANIRFEGVYTTNNTDRTPYDIAKQIIRHVNLLPWNGDKEFTWLCTEVSWELSGYMPATEIAPALLKPLADVLPNVNPSFPLYKMSFEFQFNHDTWDPFVVFIDPDTGNPPADIKEGDVVEIFPNGVQVKNSTRHPDTNNIIPAGAFSVPALPRLDFKQFFKNATIDGVPNP